LALSLILAPCAGVANAQQLGTATVTGQVRVDGQVATGSVPVEHATRISTASGSTASFSLAGGGEVRMDGQSDVIVTMGSTGPVVQLICGQVTVTGGAVKVMSEKGARVEGTGGTVTVLYDVSERKSVKSGKTRDFDDPIVADFTVPGTTGVVMSRAQCNCNCP
jgi:ferric-dicitrate binding protein FerR (iron transport regulator)